MRVKVLFFGMLRDITGLSEDTLQVGAGSSLQTVFDCYAARFPRIAELAPSIVLAANQRFSPLDTAVSDGDEVAFLPPVSGGSGEYTHQITTPEGHFFALTRGPVDTAAVRRRLLQGHDGAIVVFEGVVRNHTQGRATRFLDYDCYEPMAVQMMAEIGREIAASMPVSRIAMVHRLGRMEINETSVAVLVTAPHRKPAFDAALEGINRLKKRVPIWKKEHFADGEVWVEGEWDESLLRR